MQNLIVPQSRTRPPRQKTISKVLLFRSPLVYHEHLGHEDPHPPLELLYLGAALKSDYDVCIVDGQRQYQRVTQFGVQKRLGLTDEQIVSELAAFGPDLVGISVMWHHQIPAVHYFAKLMKDRFPEVLIVAGGIAPSSSPETLMETGDIDFVISGDGERALVRLCESLTKGEPLSGVAGLTYREGKTPVSVTKENITALDEIRFPAYELINLYDYDSGYKHGYHKSFPMSGILPSRGCPLACHFCSLPAVSERKFRTHTVERVIEDMLRMRDEFGIREVHFYDDNVINNRPFSIKLFQEMVNRKVGLTWLPEAGFALWKITKELLEWAKASGMHRLDLPIETGSERVKDDIMDKGLYGNTRVEDIVRMAREVGIANIHGYVIVGSPGETLEDMKQTLDFVNQLDLDYRGIRFGQPFPGTQFFEICQEKGYLDPAFTLDRLWFTYPNIQTKDFRIEDVTALVAADRGAAMIRQGKRTRDAAIEEIRLKQGQTIAEAADPLIDELQSRYQAKRTQWQTVGVGERDS